MSKVTVHLPNGKTEDFHGDTIDTALVEFGALLIAWDTPSESGRTMFAEGCWTRVTQTHTESDVRAAVMPAIPRVRLVPPDVH